MHSHRSAFRPLLLVLAAGLCEASCGKQESKPPTEQAPAPPSAAPAPRKALAPGPEREPELDARETAPGWTHFVQQNDVPLCVFADETAALKVDFVRDVKKQRVGSKASPHLTVFAPDCVSVRCLTASTLECWAELVNGELVVQSRYSGNRRDGEVCTEDCEPITASCPLPQLAAGTHVIRYGEHTMQLKLPGVLTKPCIAVD
jgi:hypothetical protein